MHPLFSYKIKAAIEIFRNGGPTIVNPPEALLASGPLTFIGFIILYEALFLLGGLFGNNNENSLCDYNNTKSSKYKLKKVSTGTQKEALPDKHDISHHF